jgi:hypothetical protein
MTGDRLREALAQLGISHAGFARFVSVHPRTVRYWLSGKGPVPVPIVLLVEVMLECRITPERASQIAQLRAC